MRKILLLFFIMLFAFQGASFAGTDENLCYSNFSKKELLNDLAFAEKQMFNKTYKTDEMTVRLERLELAVFGAIQNGSEDIRIKRMRKSLTKAAYGGNALQSSAKPILNLMGGGFGNTNWEIGNMHNSFPGNYHTPHYYGRHGLSHVVPRCPHCRSHMIPHPHRNNYTYSSDPITNGDFSKNYSIGTGVKILDD